LDLKDLVSIFNRARELIDCFKEKEADLEKFKALVEGEEIHAAVINGKIAGFVSVWAAEDFLHHLYVAPEYQNRGAVKL